MPVGKLILLGLLGLVVAEAAVFLLIAQAFGSFVAIVALLSTSVLGVGILARMGRRLAGRLADILSHRDFGATEVGSSGFLNTLGGLLLVLPGFITDCIGLLLLIPAVQQHLKGRLPGARPRPAGRILELERSQWRDLPDRHIPGDRREPPKVPPRRTRRG
ncbi:MAG: FxsA family protein [Pseudorhodoplanes sp.]